MLVLGDGFEIELTAFAFFDTKMSRNGAHDHYTYCHAPKVSQVVNRLSRKSFP